MLIHVIVKCVGPPVDGPKVPWPCVLSLPRRFVADLALLACDNMLPMCYYVSNIASGEWWLVSTIPQWSLEDDVWIGCLDW